MSVKLLTLQSKARMSGLKQIVVSPVSALALTMMLLLNSSHMTVFAAPQAAAAASGTSAQQTTTTTSTSTSAAGSAAGAAGGGAASSAASAGGDNTGLSGVQGLFGGALNFATMPLKTITASLNSLGVPNIATAPLNAVSSLFQQAGSVYGR